MNEFHFRRNTFLDDSFFLLQVEVFQFLYTNLNTNYYTLKININEEDSGEENFRMYTNRKQVHTCIYIFPQFLLLYHKKDNRITKLRRTRTSVAFKK